MFLRENTLLQGGKYKIVRYIGRGGFGCTYQAQNVMLCTQVAIKELFVSDFCMRDSSTGQVSVFTESKQSLFDKLCRKFIDEARAIASLVHPGIVRVTDVFIENGTAYYVMDYVDGYSLHDLVKRVGALSEQNSLYFIRQVAQSLQYVHEKKLLHLDIKPGNIMVTGESLQTILIDFGVSKQYDEVSGENTSSLMGYSPGYAPPEQMNRRVGTFLPATDIYALGATLYNLLSGQMPLPSNEIASGEELPPLPDSVSEPIRRAVAAAMTINKRTRPQSVAEFLAILDSKTPDTHTADQEFDKTPKETEGMQLEAELVVENTSQTRTDGRDATQSFDERREAPTVRQNADQERWQKLIPMVYVSGGTFTMGATSEQGDEAVDREKPPHQVTVSSFYMGKYEVTQAQWEAVMGSNPSKYKGSNLPVERVSYDDAVAFCLKLSTLTGRTYRLPTEAEWEYAARGGNQSRGYKYSGSNDLSSVAWYSGFRGTHDVGTKRANELGLYDMSGNVWEWCSDRYGDYSTLSQTNPQGPGSGFSRVIRGGGWCDCDASGCRVSYRSYGNPSYRDGNLGFRVVLEP